MRAGLLSDPRVVALLQDLFVPCMMSALNTPDLIGNPQDVALLAQYAASGREQFVGGEREAFLLPDGTMLDVFMSLGTFRATGGGKSHDTAAARRSPAASAAFRHHGALALRACHGEVPAVWERYWDGSAPTVAAVRVQGPEWPVPPAGSAALRVFVRNGHLAYDDLHGIELLPLDGREVVGGALAVPGDAAALAPGLFRDLVRAMVPRGDVDTRLAEESIGGTLRLCGERLDGELLRGRVEGWFTMTPRGRDEVGRRRNAAGLFVARGRFAGEFALQRSNGQLRSLRIAAVDTDLRSLPPWCKDDAGEPHAFAIACELVALPATGAR